MIESFCIEVRRVTGRYPAEYDLLHDSFTVQSTCL